MVKNEIIIKKEFRDLDNSGFPDEFSVQMDKLAGLLSNLYEYRETKGQDEFPCVVDFFNKNFNQDHRRRIIKQINRIGFDNIRDSFDILNRECESFFCEQEDLFGIFKRHQLNKQEPASEFQKFKLLGRYFHLTLIHQNLLKNKNIKKFPLQLLESRNHALKVIEPLLSEIYVIISELQEEKKKNKINNRNLRINFTRNIFLNF